MPNNIEITPGSLPPNVDYTETMTYTRNLSPTGSTSQTLALADQSAVVRFTHAKTDLGAVDVQIDGATTFTGVGFGAESSDQVLSTGSHTLALVPAGSAGPILYSTMVSMTGNSTHRLTAAGDVTHTVTLDLIHNPPPPPAGKATIRFAHASPDAPSLDVVLMDDGSVLFGSTLVMSVTAPLDVDAGAHSFGIYEAGSNQLLAQVSITLTDSGKYSLIAVGRLNGAPGLQLVAQADELPSAQVSLVNALAASQSIDLWTQGITVFQSISNTASSPYYQFSGNTLDVELKPAGDSSTSLFNGSFPLQANADQTMVALD